MSRSQPICSREDLEVTEAGETEALFLASPFLQHRDGRALPHPPYCYETPVSCQPRPADTLPCGGLQDWQACSVSPYAVINYHPEEGWARNDEGCRVQEGWIPMHQMYRPSS